MIPAQFEYVAAESAVDALDLLAEYGDDAKLLAGGHSLLPMMKLRLAAPQVLIDIGGLTELAGVSTDGD
ncbi:MAG: FAD binding domain-containing protein, partial [Streptosporangiaceae bacterium]